MDTKIVQLVEAGDTEENSIQIHDQLAPQSIPSDATLKKTEYNVEVWDNLAPNSVPVALTSPKPIVNSKDTKVTTSGPTNLKKPPVLHPSEPKVGFPLPHNPVKTLPAYLWRQVPGSGSNSQTPKPEASSFWPGFLDFFSGGSQENKPTPRPVIPMSLPPYLDKQPTIRPGLGMHVPMLPPKIQKKPQMITLSNKNGTKNQHVTMHHLSHDEHLTILKVDEETNHTHSNEEPSDDQEVSKSDYIVLHKLPNGEALNLENLETYASMADVESGIKNTKPESYKPRSLEPFLDYDIPPSPKVISERPYPADDVYEPIPLEELEDLEAMPGATKPVYIINPLKGDQNISGKSLFKYQLQYNF